VPLLQGRKIYFKGLVGELRAFVANEKTNEGFKKHGCNFWGSWANDDGSLDVDYARLLHDFNGVNQLERVIDSIKNKPDSRKHVISLWDPSSEATQVPCVLSYQWYVEEGKLLMIWSQRSVDVMIGLASDMFSAWLFNRLMAKTCGLEPGAVIMQLGDCHVYANHMDNMGKYLEQLRLEECLYKPHYKLEGDLYDFKLGILNYDPMPKIDFELAT